MKQLSITIAIILVAGCWGSPVLAEPEICKVALTSAEAGSLEVRKTILPPDIESVVHSAGSIYSIWSPATSGNSVSLVLHYTGADQDKRVGNLDGITVEFPSPKGAMTDEFTAQLVADDIAPLNLDQAARLAGTDRLGFILDGSRPADRAMGHLLGQGASVKIVIFQADRVLQQEMFEGTQMSLTVLGEPKAIIAEVLDTTAIAARDKLFAQAEPPVTARDPKVCTPLQYQSGVLVEASPQE